MIARSFIKSILSNQFNQINFINSMSSNQVHEINLIKSFAFHFINFIISDRLLGTLTVVTLLTIIGHVKRDSALPLGLV